MGAGFPCTGTGSRESPRETDASLSTWYAVGHCRSKAGRRSTGEKTRSTELTASTRRQRTSSARRCEGRPGGQRLRNLPLQHKRHAAQHPEVSGAGTAATKRACARCGRRGDARGGGGAQRLPRWRPSPRAYSPAPPEPAPPRAGPPPRRSSRGSAGLGNTTVCVPSGTGTPRAGPPGLSAPHPGLGSKKLTVPAHLSAPCRRRETRERPLARLLPSRLRRGPAGVDAGKIYPALSPVKPSVRVFENRGPHSAFGDSGSLGRG